MINFRAALLGWLVLCLLCVAVLPAEAIRVSAGCGVEPPVSPGTTGSGALLAQGIERTFRLHVPEGYEADSPMSLVLSFHGYSGTAFFNEVFTTGLSAHADDNGYVVVYPQGVSFGGTPTSWNDRTCNASPGPEGATCTEDAFDYTKAPECGDDPDFCDWCTCFDDVAFVDALLDDLEETLCLDLDRIYATGMSNGGMFAHRLGCSLSHRLAAVAPVAGTLAKGFSCGPPRGAEISMLHIHGRDDTTVPFDGSPASDGFLYVPVNEILEDWGSPLALDCAPEAVPYPTSGDGQDGFGCRARPECDPEGGVGREVVACLWDAGHSWPRGFGNDVIWEFFQKNPRRPPTLPIR